MWLGGFSQCFAFLFVAGMEVALGEVPQGDTEKNQLRQALLVSVSRIVEAEVAKQCGAFEELDDGKLSVDQPVVHMLAEFLLQKSELFAKDLYAFAGHARRTGINTDDIKLCFRRRPDILSHLDDFEQKSKSRVQDGKKRKKEPQGSID